MQPIDLENGKSLYFADLQSNIYWQFQSRFKLMTPRLNNGGYLYLNISRHKYFIHRLVAKTFIPNPAGKPEVNHIDGNKLNNNLDNLEWVTRSENMRHAHNTGLTNVYRKKGSKQSNAKLTEAVVTEIKQRLLAGDSGYQMAKEYGVAHGRIYDIKNGRSWTHVTIERASGISDE